METHGWILTANSLCDGRFFANVKKEYLYQNVFGVLNGELRCVEIIITDLLVAVLSVISSE